MIYITYMLMDFLKQIFQILVNFQIIGSRGFNKTINNHWIRLRELILKSAVEMNCYNVGIWKYIIRQLIVNKGNFSCNKVYAAERMTVNHDVAGSSPAGGAISREWIYPKIYSFLIY